MLAGREEKREVPYERGSWCLFRTLSGRELDEAEAAATEKALAMVKGLPAEAMTAMQTQTRTTERAPADSYDKDILIKYGLIGWSLDVTCTEENKANLDARTRQWVVDQIVEMNVRPEGEGDGSEANTEKA